jgi:hypothetical protein
VDALSWKCLSTEESLAFGPTQGDEKRLPFGSYSLWKHRPPLCHLDRSAAQWRDLCVNALSWKCLSTEESWAFGPTQGDEKRLPFGSYPLWQHRPPLCHLDRSAAQWRDLCADALSWKCLSTEESLAFGPTQGDEKRLPFGSYSLWQHRPPLCHLDRSAAQWRDLCVNALSWKYFSTERSRGLKTRSPD